VRKASAQSGRQHRTESNNKAKYRNNYFTWGRIMFWMLICASIRWYHLFSQMSTEWQLGCSTKVTVHASCRGGLFTVPWFSEQCRDKAIWSLSLSVLQSCLFQLLRSADHLLENLLLVWPTYYSWFFNILYQSYSTYYTNILYKDTIQHTIPSCSLVFRKAYEH